MINIRQIKENEWKILKELRLASLIDTPSAFIEKLHETQRTPDSKWQDRAKRHSQGKNSSCSLAFDGQNPVGLAVGFLDKKNKTIAYLIAMWVHSRYQSQNIGQLLVEDIEKWASSVGAHTLMGGITPKNESVLTYYQKMGFESYHGKWDSPATRNCNLILKKKLIK